LDDSINIDHIGIRC